MGTHPSFTTTGAAGAYQPKTTDESDNSVAGTVVPSVNTQKIPGVHPLATPVATALTYATGKCIGGPMALAGFVRAAGLSSLIQSAVLRAAQEVLAAEVDVLVFRGQPTVATGLADNATFAVAAADVPLVSKVLKFTSFDSLGGGSISNLDGIGRYMALAAGTSAYVQFVARGAITLVNAADLSVSLALMPD